VGEREHGGEIVGAAVLRKEMKLTGGGHLSASKRNKKEKTGRGLPRG
jgi:hypothetical protein